MTTEVTNQNDALNVLVQGIKLAVKRGAFEIEEIDIFLKAIKIFTLQESESKTVADVKSVETKVKTLAQ